MHGRGAGSAGLGFLSGGEGAAIGGELALVDEVMDGFFCGGTAGGFLGGEGGGGGAEGVVGEGGEGACGCEGEAEGVFCVERGLGGVGGLVVVFWCWGGQLGCEGVG